MSTPTCIAVRAPDGTEHYRVHGSGYASWACLTPSFLLSKQPGLERVLSAGEKADGPCFIADNLTVVDFQAKHILSRSSYSEIGIESNWNSVVALKTFGACYAHLRAASADFYEKSFDPTSFRFTRTPLTPSQVHAYFKRVFIDEGVLFDSAAEEFKPPTEGIQFRQPADRRFSLTAIPTQWTLVGFNIFESSDAFTLVDQYLRTKGWKERLRA